MALAVEFELKQLLDHDVAAHERSLRLNGAGRLIPGLHYRASSIKVAWRSGDPAQRVSHH
mgnify:CR=1 FL=1